jgi:hypothetical protein
MSLTGWHSVGYHESKEHWLGSVGVACEGAFGEKRPCLVARCAGRGKGGALRRGSHASRGTAQPGARGGPGCAKLGERLGILHQVQIDPLFP